MVEKLEALKQAVLAWIEANPKKNVAVAALVVGIAIGHFFL